MGYSGNQKWKVSELRFYYTKRQYGRHTVTNSDDLYRLVMSFWDRDMLYLQETMYVLLFDTKNHCIGFRKMFTGSASGITVDKKLIYAAALTSGAQAIAVAHNHPSGDYHPSLQDVAFTKSLYEGCQTLDLKLLDHLIVTDEGYFSFNDEDLIR